MAGETTTAPAKAPIGSPDRAKQIVQDVRAQLAGKKPEAPAAAPAAPAPAPPVEAPKAEAPRNEKGQFEADPHKAAMREVIKRQQEELKRLRESATSPATASVTQVVSDKERKRQELLATMSPQTREWFEKSGRELTRLEAEEALQPHQRALAKADADLRAADDEARWNAEYNDWQAGMLADGMVVDNRAMLNALRDFEEKGYSFGKSNAEHFTNVFALLQQKDPGAGTVVKTGEAAAEAAKKEAADRAAAAGVRPGGTVTPNPEAERQEHLKQLREASLRNDQTAMRRLLSQRFKGLGVLPSERGRASPEDGG